MYSIMFLQFGQYLDLSVFLFDYLLKHEIIVCYQNLAFIASSVRVTEEDLLLILKLACLAHPISFECFIALKGTCFKFILYL